LSRTLPNARPLSRSNEEAGLDARSTKSGVSFVRTTLKKVALLLVVLAVAGVSVASTEARPTKPAPSLNFILVLTDDQGANTLPYMPHVGDEFKSKATTFPNATYNFPLCCPSRVSILRGQYTQPQRLEQLRPGRWLRSRQGFGYPGRADRTLAGLGGLSDGYVRQVHKRPTLPGRTRSR
jgi:hypothetical protein